MERGRNWWWWDIRITPTYQLRGIKAVFEMQSPRYPGLNVTIDKDRQSVAEDIVPLLQNAAGFTKLALRAESHVAPLLCALQKNTYIAELVIRADVADVQFFDALAKVLGEKTALKTLTIICGGAILSSEISCALVEALAKNKTLTKIDFRCRSKIDPRFVSGMCCLLRENTTLEMIHWNTDDTLFDMSAVFRSLESNITLRCFECFYWPMHWQESVRDVEDRNIALRWISLKKNVVKLGPVLLCWGLPPFVVLEILIVLTAMEMAEEELKHYWPRKLGYEEYKERLDRKNTKKEVEWLFEVQNELNK